MSWLWLCLCDYWLIQVPCLMQDISWLTRISCLVYIWLFSYVLISWDWWLIIFFMANLVNVCVFLILLCFNYVFILISLKLFDNCTTIYILWFIYWYCIYLLFFIEYRIYSSICYATSTVIPASYESKGGVNSSLLLFFSIHLFKLSLFSYFILKLYPPTLDYIKFSYIIFRF